jgi:hypothetical protein
VSEKKGKRKTAAKGKTAAKSAARIPQPHGGALLAGGVVGNKGGTGRPPNEWRERMQNLIHREDVVKNLEDIASDLRIRSDPQRAKLYLDAMKFASEQAYPKESGSLEVRDGDRVLKVSFG